MPPKNSTRKRTRTELADVASSSKDVVSRPRRLSEPAQVSTLTPHPIAAFLRFSSIEEWATTYPLDMAEVVTVPRELALLVALTLGTSLDSPLTAIVWTPLPGWNSLTAATDGQILSVQHQETGFRLDPKMVSFLYGRLAANLGVMVGVEEHKMFLPTVVIDGDHVFAGNRQASFANLTPEKLQIAAMIMTIIMKVSNAKNRLTIPRLAQTTISLLSMERQTELGPLVRLLEQADSDDFYAKTVEFLETLDVTDGVKAPVVSALIAFGFSAMEEAEKYRLLLTVRAKLSRRSLTQFATNLGIRLPVTDQAMNRYTGKNQAEIPVRAITDLHDDDLVILGSQVATGDAVMHFLEKPPIEVYCASGFDKVLYFRSKPGEVSEKAAGTFEDVKLSTMEGGLISRLCTKPEAQMKEAPPVVPAALVVVDSF